MGEDKNPRKTRDDATRRCATFVFRIFSALLRAGRTHASFLRWKIRGERSYAERENESKWIVTFV